MNPKPTPSRFVDLNSSTTGIDALRCIGRSSLGTIEHNEELALDSKPDGVHQMRVSVRRFRSTLSSFHNCVPSDQYDWLTGELKWIAFVLGEARDLDVFGKTIIGKMVDKEWNKIPPAFQEPFQQLRDAAYLTVRQSLNSPRYNALKFGMEQWLDTDQLYIGTGELLEKPLCHSVPIILTKRYDDAKKRAKKFNRQSDKKRHKLRIALKKLRYGSEIFGVMYDKEKVEEFTSQLKDLQDDLGDANDVTTASAIIKKIVKKNPDTKDAGEELIAYHEDRIADNETKMQHHVEKFFNTPIFFK